MHLSIQQHPSVNTGDVHAFYFHLGPICTAQPHLTQAAAAPTTPDLWYQPSPNLFTVGKSKGTDNPNEVTIYISVNLGMINLFGVSLQVH
jgi:hypothetical protein